MTIPDALFSEVQDVVAQQQPELSISRTEKLIVLEGQFLVCGPDGPVDTPDGVFDTYNIQAGVTAGFPVEEPVVFEIGGRVPRIADRHVFPEDGNCCLGVWEEWLLTAPDHRFETFLTGPIHDYFVSQTHFEINGTWPYGERSHGVLGVLESYSELLGVPQDVKIIRNYLRLLSRKKISGHALCPCGSRKRLRDCHRNEILKLSEVVPRSIARQMYTVIAPKKAA